MARTSFVALGTLFVLAVAAFSFGNDWMRLATVIGALGLFGIYFYKILKFAEKNPDIAAMEGLELSQLHQARLAAKDTPQPVESLPTENPHKTQKAFVTLKAGE